MLYVLLFHHCVDYSVSNSFFIIILLLFHMYGFYLHVNLQHMHALPIEAKRELQSPGTGAT